MDRNRKIFRRPEYGISFHVNTDSADLIGTDTFINNEVRLRKGPIYQCAEFGGFGILDEINMAKNDAVSVLHATLDHRRRIDIPGYNRILLHPATRFIGTMNYGYAGTRDLNEALVSRFMVIDMPEMDEDSVLFVLRQHFPDGEKSALKTVCSSLMERPEKNKILIVLSDGKPCDMSIQRPGTRQPKIYDGEGAMKDTAYEVRRARNQGIFVIGIFVGNEEELSVEKRIYGKDFAYIRNISNFSRMVGTFLRRQIDME